MAAELFCRSACRARFTGTGKMFYAHLELMA